MHKLMVFLGRYFGASLFFLGVYFLANNLIIYAITAIVTGALFFPSVNKALKKKVITSDSQDGAADFVFAIIKTIFIFIVVVVGSIFGFIEDVKKNAAAPKNEVYTTDNQKVVYVEQADEKPQETEHGQSIDYDDNDDTSTNISYSAEDNSKTISNAPSNQAFSGAKKVALQAAEKQINQAINGVFDRIVLSNSSFKYYINPEKWEKMTQKEREDLMLAGTLYGILQTKQYGLEQNKMFSMTKIINSRNESIILAKYDI